MRDRLARQGLDIEPRIVVVTRLIPEADGTSSDQRLEPIVGTHSATILRVPFHNSDGTVHPHWLSRFEIWPYLERFSFDVEREVLGRTQWPARPHHRQLFGRQSGRHAPVAAAEGDPSATSPTR